MGKGPCPCPSAIEEWALYTSITLLPSAFLHQGMHISFLTTVSQYRDPKLLWPLAAIASLLVHGTALALLRPVLETRSAVDELATSPPIQLLTLAPDSEPAAYSGEVDPIPPDLTPRNTSGAESEPAVTPPPESAADPAPPNPVEPPPEVASSLPTAPSPPASSSPATPAPVDPPPATPAPEVAPRPPVTPTLPAEPSPAPPTGATSEAPAPRPPVDSPPPVSSPPTTPSPAPPRPSAPGGGASETGGQLQALRIVQEQQARDIPDSPPRLTGTTRISLDPLPAGCQAAGDSSALTSGQVNLRIRVEASGEISYTTVVQSSGNPALDELVSCVVRQALQVEPASVGGTPLPSTDYVLETQVQMPF